LIIGFGGGWTIKHWKDSGEIVHLKARAEVAEAKNEQCKIDVADVRQNVSGMVKAAEDRAKAVEA
jgi:hypothetical protein